MAVSTGVCAYEMAPKHKVNNNKVIDEKQIIKETHSDTKGRFDKFKHWLDSRNEKNIAVVSHGMFLSQVTGEMLDNCGHYIWEYK